MRSELLAKEIYSEDASCINTKRKLTACQQCNNLSSQFLTALPDVLGIMSNQVILEAFHQCIGQASPAMRPFVGTTHYIGRYGKEAVDDEYGDVVARSSIGKEIGFADMMKLK